MSNVKKFLTEKYILIREFSQTAVANRVDVYAACTSFYIFLSFVPFMVLIIALIPFLPFSQSDLERLIMGVIPAHYMNIVQYLLDELYTNSKTALSLSTVAVLWSSSKGVLGITKGLNEIFNVKEYRNQIFMRIRSVYYTLFLLAGLILTLVLSVFGNYIIAIIGRYVHIPDFVYLIFEFKNLAVLIISILLFWYLFVALPAKKIGVKSQFIGAFVSAFVWWGFSRLFSLYLSGFDSYSIYGSFAVVIILGVWLYFGMYVMFMGASLNEFIASKKGNRHEG